MLTQAGYQVYRMDHFARPDDELVVAQREGVLHHFQGYTTRGDTDSLYGVSAISMIWRWLHAELRVKELKRCYPASG